MQKVAHAAPLALTHKGQSSPFCAGNAFVSDFLNTINVRCCPEEVQTYMKEVHSVKSQQFSHCVHTHIVMPYFCLPQKKKKQQLDHSGFLD